MIFPEGTEVPSEGLRDVDMGVEAKRFGNTLTLTIEFPTWQRAEHALRLVQSDIRRGCLHINVEPRRSANAHPAEPPPGEVPSGPERD